MAPRKADPEPPVESRKRSLLEEAVASESETSETSESSSSEEDVPAPRKKVPLNEARLEQLRQAREKAVEARKRIGDVKRAEKALKERELQARIERVQAMEKQLLKKTTPPIPVKKRKHAPPPPSSSSESESESSNSEEEREATRWVASSSTDGGHRPRKSKHSRRARSLPQRPVEPPKQHVHALAYGSLFPGAGNNPYI